MNELGYEVLPLLPYSPDLLPTDYYFFKHLDNFLQGKHFHNQQDAENAFQEFVEPWRMDFYMIRIFLISKNVLIKTVAILINIVVFEPSYKDLKFMVRNHNYVCIKLTVFLPKMYNLNQSMMKRQTTPNWGTFYKTTDLLFKKMS